MHCTIWAEDVGNSFLLLQNIGTFARCCSCEITLKVIARIRGGIGNQLFCFAVARRLALVNNAELVLDDVTGFARDHQYRRSYALDHFDISIRKATAAERLEPFGIFRRAFAKRLSRKQLFENRRYFEQEGIDFDPRLLALQVRGTIYLDGLWQSEAYFKDVEPTIRKELRIIPPSDALNQRIAEEIRQSDAVSLHVRWFDGPHNPGVYNLSADYYQRAIGLIKQKVESPRYFVFSDDPQAARAKLDLPDEKATFISHNRGDENGFADLWLMTQCRHFVTANSTFSWWGAWLGQATNKIVVTPNLKLEGKAAWGFAGLIPRGWLTI